MNTILLFLSDYKDKNRLGNPVQEQEYTYQNGSKYTGTQTNEAPIRCLFDLVKEDIANPRIDRILTICSDKVLHEKVGETGKTSFEHFQSLILELEGQHQYSRHIEVIPISYDEQDAENTADRNSEVQDHAGSKSADRNASRIYREIAQCLNSGDRGMAEEKNVYIDYTGGFRDISFLMTTIVRYLEVAGIHCKAIIYSDYQNHEIKDINYIYKMFQQINAVNEFLTTGNAQELGRIYQYSGAAVKKIISAIQNVSDTVLMCNVDDIDSSLKTLDDALTVEIEESDLSSELFKSLLPLIKTKMHLTENRMEYTDLIAWCLDNRMIQQAVTFYVEKMPVYYFDKGLVPSAISLDSVNEKSGVQASSTQVKAFYENLFQWPLDHDKDKAAREVNDKDEAAREVNDLKSILQEIIAEAKDRHFNFIGKEFCDHQLNRQKQKYPMLQDCIKRIQDDIDQWYDIRGNRITREGQNVPSNLAGNIRGFINSALNNERYLEYCITGERQDNDDTAAKKPNTTYGRKVEALRKIRAGEVNFSDHNERQETLHRMEYYLAVKIIRNHMNHAAGENNNRDTTEKMAIEYLKKEARISCMQELPPIDDVIEILRTGINF